MMKRKQNSGGFTLIEVMISAAIIAIMAAALLASLVKIDMNNRRYHDRTIAYRACHQWIETLMAQDLDTMILADRSTFDVNGMSIGMQKATVYIRDLNWAAADKAYEIRIELPYEIRAQGPSPIVTLVAVRTRT